MKKALKHNKKVLTYDELNALCQQLQDKVTQGISTQQQLISIRDELDKELNRYRLIQDFSRETLSQVQLLHFSEIAVEYFVKAFEQPRCVLLKYHEEEVQFELLSHFGCSKIIIPDTIPARSFIACKQDTILLSQHPKLSKVLSFLGLQEALVGKLIGPNHQINGLVICGQQKIDQRFYPLPSQKDLPSFSVMASKAAHLLHHIKFTEQLKQEIQERRRVEKMLEAKAEALMRSNAELEQFAYIVSHDLKAPLQNVKGYARLLTEKQGTQLNEQGKEYISIITHEMNRFENTINALLKYARLSASDEDIQAVNFQLLLEKIKLQLHLSLQHKDAVISTTNLPTLNANARQMEQLILNLITNALKFVPEGTQPHIEIEAKRINGSYQFSVKDNGIGIPEGYTQTIFGLFKRIDKDAYEGSGIGLSICKKIITQHKGKIWAASEGTGKGSTFYFTLPVNS